MVYKFNGIDYKLEKNIKEGFVLEEVVNRITDYFSEFYYILGDWAYGKLRLKGFYNESNKKVKDLNNIKFLDKYLENNCAYDCKWFLIKKFE